MNVFQKLKLVRELVNDVYPKMSLEELTQVVQFLSNNWQGKKRKKVKLTQQQLTIYELLTENGYNLSTVYRWLLLATAPSEIKERVKNNELSVREALKQRREQRQYCSFSEQQFIQAVIKCVEMYVSEPSENYPGKVSQ